jgi:hypothetical protein
MKTTGERRPGTVIGAHGVMIKPADDRHLACRVRDNMLEVDEQTTSRSLLNLRPERSRTYRGR